MAKDELKIEELGEQQYSKEQYPLQELIQINEGLNTRFEQLKEQSRF